MNSIIQQMLGTVSFFGNLYSVYYITKQGSHNAPQAKLVMLVHAAWVLEMIMTISFDNERLCQTVSFLKSFASAVRVISVPVSVSLCRSRLYQEPFIGIRTLVFMWPEILILVVSSIVVISLKASNGLDTTWCSPNSLVFPGIVELNLSIVWLILIASVAVLSWTLIQVCRWRWKLIRNLLVVLAYSTAITAYWVPQTERRMIVTDCGDCSPSDYIATDNLTLYLCGLVYSVISLLDLSSMRRSEKPPFDASEWSSANSSTGLSRVHFKDYDSPDGQDKSEQKPLLVNLELRAMGLRERSDSASNSCCSSSNSTNELDERNQFDRLISMA